MTATMNREIPFMTPPSDITMLKCRLDLLYDLRERSSIKEMQMRDPFNTRKMSDEEMVKFDQEMEDFLGLVESGDCSRVRKILESEPRWAVADDSVFQRVRTDKMAKLLLQYGADPNSKGYRGMTPLHHAAYAGHPEVVPSLIAAGADLDALDDRGCTPLTYSSRDHMGKEITRMLLEAGATYTITAAASLGDIEGVKRFLEEDPQAIEKVPAKDWLFTAALVTSNSSDKARIPIMSLIMEHYDWGKSFLRKNATGSTTCRTPKAQAELKSLINEFAKNSKKP